jgi:DNA-directed RNA polymerase
MILKAAQADLMDWSPNLELFIVRFQISPETQEELDRFMYPLPMVVEPKPIRTNKDTGYFLGSGSVILKNNHHGDDVCLDHLNRVNRIKLTINMAVVKMVHNKWKNLERIKPGETREEFAARKKAFVKYDRVARDVVEFLMQESDHFYLTHKYDKRGRVYSQGYHVSDQGNDWNKAVIEFANREVIDG